MTNLESSAPSPTEIVNCLKQEMKLREVCRRIWCKKIVAHAAQGKSLTVTSEEIQQETENQRRAQRLEKASDTLAWLEEHMITEDDWEAGIYDYLLAKKLAKALFEKDVEKYFAENKLNYEQFRLYQIVVTDEKMAQELFYQIEEEEISFYEAAHRYDIDTKRKYRCGFEGKLYRWSLKPDISAIVFGASPGEVIGPLKTEQGYHLFIIEEFIPAQLTPERRQEIINKMFEEWLSSELGYMFHNQ
ncbi:MAG: peptidylprolyl isomerase [Cyanothece sp. SIO1E1]|nr:peptidylprolyl isomerase [Cyanothece sp. SIO1E1]